MARWGVHDPIHLVDAGNGFAFHDVAWKAGERIPSFTHIFSVVSCPECIEIMGGTVEGRCADCLVGRHAACTGMAEVREITFGEWVISDEGRGQPCMCLDDECQKDRITRMRARKSD
jgi:hypothetical protein